MRIPFEGRFQVCQTWDSLVASLWSNQVFADVVLIIAEDGSEIRYHCCILSSVSPVFDRMLSQSITSNFKIFESKSAPSAVLSAEVAVRTLGSFWHYRRDSGLFPVLRYARFAISKSIVSKLTAICKIRDTIELSDDISFPQICVVGATSAGGKHEVEHLVKDAAQAVQEHARKCRWLPGTPIFRVCQGLDRHGF